MTKTSSSRPLFKLLTNVIKKLTNFSAKLRMAAPDISTEIHFKILPH